MAWPSNKIQPAPPSARSRQAKTKQDSAIFRLRRVPIRSQIQESGASEQLKFDHHGAQGGGGWVEAGGSPEAG